MAYTEVSFEDASDIIMAANLPNLINLEKLSGGWANSNYKLTLTDNSKIVLKIWDEQSINHVSYLLSITTYLSDNNIPTPSPIEFSNGEFIIVKNGLAWTLLPFIEGKWLEPNTASLYSLGRIQAKLHLVNPPDNLKQEFSMGHSLFEKLFSIADEKNQWSDFLYMLKSESLILNQKVLNGFQLYILVVIIL